MLNTKNTIFSKSEKGYFFILSNKLEVEMQFEL